MPALEPFSCGRLFSVLTPRVRRAALRLAGPAIGMTGFPLGLHPRNLAQAVTMALFAAGSISGAQTINATLRGTVTDATGSLVASAHVQLLEPATGQVVREADSQSSGDFEFDELKPGTYRLRCTASGFKGFVADNIVLDSGQIRRVDAMLPSGETSETVTVSAGAAVINTESATISDTLYGAALRGVAPGDAVPIHL